MRVSVEPGEASVRVKKNGAEVGVARPGAEINEQVNAGDDITLEAFDDVEEVTPAEPETSETTDDSQ